MTEGLPFTAESINLSVPWKVSLSLANLTMADLDIVPPTAGELAEIEGFLPFVLQINASGNKVKISLDPALGTVEELVEDLFNMNMADLPPAALNIINQIFNLTFYKQ